MSMDWITTLITNCLKAKDKENLLSVQLEEAKENTRVEFSKVSEYMCERGRTDEKEFVVKCNGFCYLVKVDRTKELPPISIKSISLYYKGDA